MVFWFVISYGTWPVVSAWIKKRCGNGSTGNESSLPRTSLVLSKNQTRTLTKRSYSMLEPKYGDVSVTLDGNVATLEIHRPPHNFFDFILIRDLANAFEALDNEPECRALLLCSEGKSFCAGANFANRGASSGETTPRAGENPLYVEGVRLFRCRKPVVAAIQGAAIGGGLGLALVADFRIATAEARFAANFVKLGIHPGFGLTYTLPRLIGAQKASLMFYTGRRVTGEEALAWGICD